MKKSVWTVAGVTLAGFLMFGWMALSPGIRAAVRVQSAWAEEGRPQQYSVCLDTPLGPAGRISCTIALHLMHHALPYVEYQDGQVTMGMGRSFGSPRIQTAVRTADEGRTTQVWLGSPSLPPLSY